MMNPILKTILWVLGALALLWVLIAAGMVLNVGGMMNGPMMNHGAMMSGGMMSGGMMGMMLVIALTWLIMLGLVGVLVYLAAVGVRSRQHE